MELSDKLKEYHLTMARHRIAVQQGKVEESERLCDRMQIMFLRELSNEERLELRQILYYRPEHPLACPICHLVMPAQPFGQGLQYFECVEGHYANIAHPHESISGLLP